MQTELTTIQINPGPMRSLKNDSEGNPANLPGVQIRYEGLSYAIQLTQQQATRNVQYCGDVVVDQLSFPYKLARTAYQLAKGEKVGEKTTTFKILDDIDGVIRPGTMTLVLSPPGHGKSCFLKALARKLPVKAVTGSVTYSGLSYDDALSKDIHIGHLVQYVNQLDEHIPQLTVQETLEFVHKNANVDPGLYGFPELSDAHKNRVSDVLSLLHLHNCANTVVGNDILRGISGGEKKRLTIGEGLITNGRVLLMDEISTGLDASVSFDIVHSLRKKAIANNLAVVIAMLQPTPEVFNQFDDIILLREGCVIFHGPKESLPGYLESLGFKLPNLSGGDLKLVSASETSQSGISESSVEDGRAVDIADFLSDLLYNPRKAAGSKIPVPLTTADMLAAWKKSDLYKQLMKPLEPAPIILDNDYTRAQYGKKFVHSIGEHVLYCIERQFTLLLRNKVFIFFRLFSACFMAIVLGGMYYQEPVSSGLPRFGLFLNMLLNLAFSNLSEMAAIVENKFIAYKHVENNSYPSFAYVLATMLSALPLSVGDCFLFCTILYWMAGLYAGAAQYFFFVFCGFLSSFFMGNLFRAVAFMSPDIQAAQAAPMPLIAILVVFTGFMVTPNHMQNWLVWIFYIDPFAYLFRAVAINEFSSPAYSNSIYQSVTHSYTTPGIAYLTSFDVFTDQAWMWYAIIFLGGAIVVAIVLAFLAFDAVRIDRNVGSARRIADENEIDDKKGAHRRKKNKAMLQAEEAAEVAELERSVSQIGVAPIEIKSVLPFVPMSIVFTNMKYTVDLPEHLGGGQKILLQDISGYALPGRMIALMGASGAGKTTLLDVLASRKNSGKMEGKILLNGFPKEEDSFSRVTSYVEQQDIHMPLTTVREAIEFSAYLRLAPEITSEQRDAFINEVMDTLELSEIADRKVGEVGSVDGLAPGERKRLTIAVELVSNSPIIFLDEPTSGLDARSAAVVMRVVKKMAKSGRTVICTIHQPSTELFLMFDDLCLLQKGGYMCYFGPIGHDGDAMIEYLQTLPGATPCPEDMNPASWMLDLLSGSDSTVGNAPITKILLAEELELVEKNPLNLKGPIPGDVVEKNLFESSIWKRAVVLIGKLSVPVAGTEPVRFPSKQARNWFEQFYILLSRQWMNYRRDIKLNVGRWNAITGLFLLFGVIYYKIDDNDVSGVTSKVAAIFMTAAFCGILNMNSAVPVLMRIRAAFYREQSSYMYDSLAYSIANFLVEAPWLALICLAVVPVLYFMMGLSADPAVFFFHYAVTFTVSLVFVQIGFLCAGTLPGYEVAQAVSGMLAPLTFLFGGLFAPVPSMPPGSQWVTWIV